MTKQERKDIEHGISWLEALTLCPFEAKTIKAIKKLIKILEKNYIGEKSD